VAKAARVWGRQRRVWPQALHVSRISYWPNSSESLSIFRSFTWTLYINTGIGYNPPMRLLVHIEGATDQAKERAGEAAWKVFEEARIHPFFSAVAIFKRDGEEEELTERECSLIELWRRAENAAAQAVGAKSPHDMNLELDISG
jgi:hypothetical protein